MIIARSVWRKVILTAVAACSFASLYEVTALDSKYAARQATMHETVGVPIPGARLAFSAAAYCKGIVTTAGVAVQAGITAADPELLPVGSVIPMDSLPPKTKGIYTAIHPGPALDGPHIDLDVT